MYQNWIILITKDVPWKLLKWPIVPSVLTLGNTVVLEVLEGMAVPAANFCGSTLTMRLFFKT